MCDPLLPKQSAWRRPALLLFVVACGASWFAFTGNYVADDSYFYLVIARNLVTQGTQTFSGLFPTNGVHPLWQYLLAGYTWIIYHLNPTWIESLAYAVPLSTALLGIGAWQFSKVCERFELNPLWLVYLPAGYLSVLGVLYSEAHTLYAALAVLTRISLCGLLERKFGPVYAAIAAAAVFLARLDSAMLLGCYGLWLLATTRRIKPAAIFASVFLALSLPYVALNVVWFGGPMPISGWMKSSFPRVFLKGIAKLGTLMSTLCGYSLVFGWLPIGLTGLILPWARRASAETRHFIVVFLGGSVLHLAYVALFTRSHTDWYWYYVIPVLLGGFACALAQRQWQLNRRPPGAASRRGQQVHWFLAILFACAWLGASSQRWRTPQPSVQAQPILQYLNDHGIEGATVMVSDWPGILAWQTSNHIVAADMLTGYRPLYEAMRKEPNSLAYLENTFEKLGRPLRLVIYAEGTAWLTPDEDLKGITYYDPRTYPELVPIGRMNVSQGPALVVGRRDAPKCIIWDLATQSGSTVPSATLPGSQAASSSASE